MDAVFLELFNRSLAAGWLVLAVALLRFALKKAPKNLNCLLWGLVALRLLLPARLKSAFSLIPSAQVLRPETLTSAAPTIQSGFPFVDQSVNPAFTASFAPAVGASVNPLQVWVRIGALLWLCGFAAMLLYALVSYLRLRRRVADSLPLRENIRLAERIASPFVLGVFRPKIYLPFGLSEETSAMVLAHEQGHIARHDHWFKPFAFLLLSLCWFHPLAWLAYVLYCRDIELACDEHVLRAWGTEVKKAYSSALLDCSVSSRSIAACPLAFGEIGIKERIRSVLRYQKPTFWILLAAGLSVAAICVCFLTDPAEAAETEPSPFAVETEKMQATLERMELGGYEPLSREDYAERFGNAPLPALPSLPDRFKPVGELYAMDASGVSGIGRARFAQLWLSPATGEALFASWLENPGRADEAMSMAYWRLINAGGTGWANFLAESRGKVGDYDVVLRYYAADPDTDPESIRGFLEQIVFPSSGADSLSGLVLVGEDGTAESLMDAARTWQSAYEAGWRDLLIELPYYTAQYLNRWLRSGDDAILDQLYADFEGSALHSQGWRDFFTAVRADCPETVFHGVDVGHQFGTTGLRYQGLLRGEGEMGSEDYGRTLEAISQGREFYRTRSYAYREQTMAENLLREYETLAGRPALGIFGAAHLTEETLGNGSAPSLYTLLREPLGDAVQVIAPLSDAGSGLSREEAELAALSEALGQREAVLRREGEHVVSLTMQVGTSVSIRSALDINRAAPIHSIGLDIYDAGYLQLFDSDDGEPMLLAKAPTETPIPIEVHSLRNADTLMVTVVPNEAGIAFCLYDEPDPAAVQTLDILFNDRPLHEYTASTSGMYYVLYAQATPGGRVMAKWTSSDESAARVTTRVDGACVLETLRPSEEAVTITAAYGEHRAEFLLHIG